MFIQKRLSIVADNIESSYREESQISIRSGKKYRGKNMPNISSAPSEILQQQTGNAMRSFGTNTTNDTITIGYRKSFFANKTINYAKMWETNAEQQRSGIREFIKTEKCKTIIRQSLKNIFS